MKLLYTALLNPNIDIFSLPSMCQIMQEALYPCLLFPVRGEGTEGHGAEVGGLLPLQPWVLMSSAYFHRQCCKYSDRPLEYRQASGWVPDWTPSMNTSWKSYILFGEKKA